MNRFLLFLICMILLTTPLPAKEKPKLKDYNFNCYTETFSQELFPDINKYLDDYRKTLSRADAKKISNEVYEIVLSCALDHKLPIFSLPDIRVFKLHSEKNITFLLTVVLILVDGEESKRDLVTTFKIRKSFLIHIQSRITAKQTEI